MNEIKVVRIYDHEQPAGYRILVDRLWPRGMSKLKNEKTISAKPNSKIMWAPFKCTSQINQSLLVDDHWNMLLI